MKIVVKDFDYFRDRNKGVMTVAIQDPYTVYDGIEFALRIRSDGTLKGGGLWSSTGYRLYAKLPETLATLIYREVERFLRSERPEFLPLVDKRQVVEKLGGVRAKRQSPSDFVTTKVEGGA